MLSIFRHKSARHYLTRQSTSTSCNPYIVSGNFHADYSEPSNNYWEPIDAATCRAPQYVKQLRAGDYKGMEWMQNRTVVLLGDSIERDHVNLFCSILGKEAETIKGKHPLAVAAGISDSMESNERKKKDRASRIAFKGMQESTLPKLCYVKELNFMVRFPSLMIGFVLNFLSQLVNMYHFGLDEQGYWQALDQFHGPGSIEERFETQFGPFISKLRSDYRASAPDLIEISSGMFDLAKWAKEDIAGEQNTEDELSADRLAWYESRVSRFMEVTTASFPAAIKVWRGVTHPEDQAAELDYFNVSLTCMFCTALQRLMIYHPIRTASVILPPPAHPTFPRVAYIRSIRLPANWHTLHRLYISPNNLSRLDAALSTKRLLCLSIKNVNSCITRGLVSSKVRRRTSWIDFMEATSQLPVLCSGPT